MAILCYTVTLVFLFLLNQLVWKVTDATVKRARGKVRVVSFRARPPKTYIPLVGDGLDFLKVRFVWKLSVFAVLNFWIRFNLYSSSARMRRAGFQVSSLLFLCPFSGTHVTVWIWTISLKNSEPFICIRSSTIPSWNWVYSLPIYIYTYWCLFIS